MDKVPVENPVGQPRHVCVCVCVWEFECFNLAKISLSAEIVIWDLLQGPESWGGHSSPDRLAKIRLLLLAALVHMINLYE